MISLSDTSLLAGLNEDQARVVASPETDLLVLAGAGSGKTRVLVQRIVWLVRQQGLSPHQILAVTFTNKAAREMRLRLENQLGVSLRTMWAGTFHGLSHRLLRTHWREAGLPEHFQVLDSDDQKALLKRQLKENQFDTERYPLRQVQSFINKNKEEGRRAENVVAQGEIDQMFLKEYFVYEHTCRRQGLVDFAELLLRALELLRDTPSLRHHYQSRFAHLLVDEFQDTNRLQYAWLKTLRGEEGRIMAVGDDDQSIYGWRGAQIENIHHFTEDFPQAVLHRLEQNYRSTGTILAAANGLIQNNQGRLGKSLWTDGAQGDPIRVYAAFNEQDEARFIVDIIQQHVREGGLRSECALLYRSNAQSRALEDALLRAGLPYRVYGGQRFYERMEIKNALAYLRLMVNRQDDGAFERVINTPTRGIGQTTLEKLRAHARDEGQGLWDASLSLLATGSLSGRAASAIKGFVQLIESLDEQSMTLSLHETVEQVVEQTGLLDFHASEKGEKGQARVDNLKELVSAVRHYEPALPLTGDDDPLLNLEGREALGVFLTEASLDAGDNQADEDQDAVQLMTLHTAKGLEFPLVFITGVEEGLFPHQMALEEGPDRLEEERRLCYVGITRAMKTLYLTHAESRRIYGKDTFCRRSRFIGEIPSQWLHEVRLRAAVSRPMMPSRQTSTPQWQSAATLAQASLAERALRIGQKVAHKKFGEGVILQAEGEGDRTRLLINFEGVGEKWLVLGFAPLQPLD